MSEELRELIAGTMTEMDPNVDNHEVETDSEALVSEYADDTVLQDEESEDLELVDEVEEADDEDIETSGETHQVKVNGEVLEVSLEELKSGYQRQADYTREKQALKKEIEEFESIQTELSTAYDSVMALEDAWEDNPITVLAQFASNTENPTHAVALLIKELAGANLLDRDFLEMFGVTPDVQRQWADETRGEQAQRQQRISGNQRERELAEAQEQLEIQRIIADYDRQIDEIIDENGFEFTVKQRDAFRKELATYAAENDLTNLKAAYKAFRFEEEQTKKKAASKTAQKVKDKKAASVVARSSGSADGGTPVTDSSDLSAVVAAAMKDVQASRGI
jgi:hypothetical protein